MLEEAQFVLDVEDGVARVDDVVEGGRILHRGRVGDVEANPVSVYGK